MKHLRVIATANTMADLPIGLRVIGEERLNSLGFTTGYAQHADNKLFHTADSAANRVRDFHDASTDPSVGGIISVFGGYNSNQLLDRLDYKKIISGNRPVIGYSDFSSILNALAAQGSKQVFHGPSFASFCDPNMFEYTYRYFAETLSGKTVIYRCEGSFASDLWFLKPDFGPRETHDCKEWKAFRDGAAIGPIYGGNLETFCKLLGTPYMPNLDGAILFLEDASGNNPGLMHRDLTQLRQAGVFDKINGLIIGKFPHGSKLDDFSHLSHILDDVLGGKNIPVLCDVFCSHVDPMMTIPIGKLAKLVTGKSAEVTINFQP